MRLDGALAHFIGEETVRDPRKAAPLFDRSATPRLIDQAGRSRFLVPNPPKTGPMRATRNPMADCNHLIYFANPGNYVKTSRRAARGVS